MKYIVTETELSIPDYKHQEEFNSLKAAQAYMTNLYKEYYQNPAVGRAEIYDRSAVVELNDGNEIHWDIDTKE